MNSKIALISDVHANYHALKSVMAHAEKQNADSFWFLGDAVNYGPDPHRCMRLLSEAVDHEYWILGNHDKAVKKAASNETGQEDKITRAIREITPLISDKPDNLKAFQMNFELLEYYPQHLKFLISLPEEIFKKPCFLVHGGQRNGTPTNTYTGYKWPVQDEFMNFQTRFGEQGPKYCMAGHTHRPACFLGKKSFFKPNFEAVSLEPGKTTSIEADYCFLNPGSVGQPRDGDWRASYMIFNPLEETVILHRVEYNIKLTQKQMAESDYPKNFIERLSLAG
ncbi:MAG: hypothetical protein GY795_18615 [Desulfobacterales bacterium]|nr:hypothetical protein [Desulfobacterales bacterium]